MCIYNPMCMLPEGFCNCRAHGFITNQINEPYYTQNQMKNNQLMQNLYYISIQQTEMMKQLLGHLHTIIEKIDTATSDSHQTTNSSNESGTTSRQSLLDYISKVPSETALSLELASQFPSTAYKGRSFSFGLYINDENKKRIMLNESVKFKICLYTSESPPQLISINTNGEKIARGTLDVEGNSIVLFKKVIVTEVTSHFRNGSVFFVVLPQNASFIKPFVVEDFIVKARKPSEREMKKKRKLSDSDEEIVEGIENI
ncbi:hypothetical protein SteCoe_23292 [Stentor coeruleus]|uniref:Uncharacterized protein n=1 Tax=Stentor coeruleus TaxID=5963 RepID=A0A1R2BK79_9CILI|nr:hypothetical protein SteCoe_23292 [Stentor coeruleus]